MDDSTHPRRLIFAVWRWPKWALRALLLILVVAIAFYPFSLPFSLYILSRTDCDSPIVMRCFDEVYWPVVEGIYSSDGFRAFNAWEWEKLTKIFGHPRPNSRARPGSSNPFHE